MSYKDFKITVKQLVADEYLDLDDKEENPAGVHYVDADDSECALDYFHLTVPISCLEDFEITIEEITKMEAIYTKNCSLYAHKAAKIIENKIMDAMAAKSKED